MSFDVGFDTVGNATVIVHDGAPVLATDPCVPSRDDPARRCPGSDDPFTTTVPPARSAALD